MPKRGNPFRPGAGMVPAHLVGRSKEQGVIEGALDSITADRDGEGLVPLPSNPIALIGPRGVGKTVLIKLTKRRARGMGVHAVELNKDLLMGTYGDLNRKINPSGRLKKYFGFLKNLKAAVKLEDVFNFEIGPSGHLEPMDLEASLVAGALAGPLRCFLDEAHTVPADRLRSVCVTFQSLIGDGYPLALVLAGTPVLDSFLMNMGGTFMERARKLRFNLLSADESREALTEGFATTGMNVEPDALDRLVGWSDRYPYFIQIAGATTWEVVEGKGGKAVSPADFEAGLPGADEMRNDFHNTRRNELIDGDALEGAIQVMGLMERNPDGLDRTELLDGLVALGEGIDMKGAKEVERRLMGLGFLYEDMGNVEAGRPSLFDYVRDKAAKKSKAY